MLSTSQRGNIVLSRENSFFSWLVCWQTESNWSHAGVLDGSGSGNVISSVPFRGVSKTPLSKIHEYGVFRVEGVNDSQLERVAELAEHKIGCSYDFTQAFLLGWKVITGTLKKNMHDPNEDKYVCSELVAELYGQIDVNFGVYHDNVLPKTIEDSKRVRLVSLSTDPE